MADEMKVNSELEATAVSADTSAVTSDYIGDKLQATSESIDRASAEAKARRLEQEKSQKRAESEAKARLAQTEKKNIESERVAAIVDEQRRAALEYAESYRQKLLKDKRKALAAQLKKEREEREAAEAKAREEKTRQIAEALERERAEARARSERAAAILEKASARLKREAEAKEAAEAAAQSAANVVAEQPAKVEEPVKVEQPVAEPAVAEAMIDEPAVDDGIITVSDEPVNVAEQSEVDGQINITDEAIDEPQIIIDGEEIGEIPMDPEEQKRQLAAADAVERFMISEMISSHSPSSLATRNARSLRITAEMTEWR